MAVPPAMTMRPTPSAVVALDAPVSWVQPERLRGAVGAVMVAVEGLVYVQPLVASVSTALYVPAGKLLMVMGVVPVIEPVATVAPVAGLRIL